jgi:predicted metalloprotease with PDZ domain
MNRLALVAACLLATTAASPAMAQVENTKPQPVPFVDTIPAPVDTPYPGTITLAVDASDTSQGIFKVKETIPVDRTGPMVLLYPKWIPGHHSPSGPLDKLAGLHIFANGKEIPWTRDKVAMEAFHIDVPEGTKEIEANFVYLSATQGNQGRIQMTPEMLSLQWDTVSLYPAGYYTRQIPIEATVKYPEGWTAYSGLPSNARGSNYAYQKTSYQTLIDSPTIAGKYTKEWPLSDRVFLDVVADTPDELKATPEQIAAHKRLVEQAVKTFGAQHYDHYHFLLTISDNLGGIGLEHHRSSEDGVDTGYFSDWDSNAPSRNLLPHEYTHSWDGKFRRPAELWTPNYSVPMRDSLLWVYEGQTQFWGYVLQARSGLVSKEDTLDAYAYIAASYDNTPGRRWRPLVDTTNDPIISMRRPKGWSNYQRSEDYYNEGLLVWMEVDSILRDQSGGKKSIDDFAKAFFGVRDGDWGELTYTFDDVVATLNSIQPYDWRGLLTERLHQTSTHAPLTGFTNNGYELVYTDEPSDYVKGLLKKYHRVDATHSIGLGTNDKGEVTTVIWDSPAFEEGLDVGDEILAVDGAGFSAERLNNAIRDAKTGKEPIRLLVKSGDQFRDIAIDYHGGLRYPHLKKTGKGETGLDRLLAPRP